MSILIYIIRQPPNLFEISPKWRASKGPAEAPPRSSCCPVVGALGLSFFPWDVSHREVRRSAQLHMRCSAALSKTGKGTTRSSGRRWVEFDAVYVNAARL